MSELAFDTGTIQQDRRRAEKNAQKDGERGSSARKRLIRLQNVQRQAARNLQHQKRLRFYQRSANEIRGSHLQTG